jgi:hypothetical protein
MRKLVKPSFDIEEFYKTCVSGVGSNNSKYRLLMWSDKIITAAKKYDDKSKLHELSEVVDDILNEGELHTVPLVKSENLISLYKNQVAKKERPGRFIYNLLMVTQNRQCPFCSVGRVKNLDHFLPKAYFSIFSVTPINLVPSCRDCNLDKKAEFAKEIRQQTLHPYYDDASKTQWLFARVAEESIPPVVEYYTDDSEIDDANLASKVKAHFEAYDLNNIFIDKAADRLSEIHFDCGVRYNRDGSQGLKSYLLEQKKSSEKIHKNSWLVAFYGGLASSEWYCNGGFIDEKSGESQEACTICQGEATFSCPDCQYGTHTSCQRCNGSKILSSSNCPSCNGSGYLILIEP